MQVASSIELCRTSGFKALEFARGITLGLLDGIPEAGQLERAGPKGNHVLWIVGHIAGADGYFHSTLSGSSPEIPESWMGLFGPGSEPTDDRSDYPPMSDLMDALATQRATLLGWLGSLDEDGLRKPMPEDLQPFAPDHATFISSLAVHEGVHAGQLSVIRRQLGLARAFG